MTSRVRDFTARAWKATHTLVLAERKFGTVALFGLLVLLTAVQTPAQRTARAPAAPAHAPAIAASAGQAAATGSLGLPAAAIAVGASTAIPEAAPDTTRAVAVPAPAVSAGTPATAVSTRMPAPATSTSHSGAEEPLSSAAAALTIGEQAALPESAPAPSLNDIEHRTFEFFWQTTNPKNGLVPDHWPLGDEPFASIAAVGFALTAYPIGVERGWITREQARQRVLTTLKFFAAAPQGPSEDGDSGYHGFYYHFLDMQTGLRYARWVEVSTVDTTWLMAGVLFDETYFDQDNPQEREIRKLAEKLYDDVDWNWAQVRPPLISMGWTPGGKFIPLDWKGYNEAMMLYILALGSPSHAIKPDAWKAWTSTYKETWGPFMSGKPHVGFAPLFGHQYSESWIDFRGIQDAWMRAHALTYFENSRISVIGQHQYAVSGSGRFVGYGADLWGLTACDGPGDTTWDHADGTITQFHGYLARGADVGNIIDDGTIAPTAAISSIVFAPALVLPTIRTMYDRYGKWLYSKYGFYDAFNPTFRLNVPVRSGEVVPNEGWFDNQYLGIDQWPILLMIENYRSGFVWQVMSRNPHIRRGLERAGFTGGWLADHNQEAAGSETKSSSTPALSSLVVRAGARALKSPPARSPAPDPQPGLTQTSPPQQARERELAELQ